MKTKVTVILLVLVIGLVVVSAGCKSEESELIGKWQSDEGRTTLEFFKDKTYEDGNIKGEWKIDDKKLILSHGNETSIIEYSFSESVLTLWLAEYPNIKLNFKKVVK